MFTRRKRPPAAVPTPEIGSVVKPATEHAFQRSTETRAPPPLPSAVEAVGFSGLSWSRDASPLQPPTVVGKPSRTFSNRCRPHPVVHFADEVNVASQNSFVLSSDGEVSPQLSKASSPLGPPSRRYPSFPARGIVFEHRSTDDGSVIGSLLIQPLPLRRENSGCSTVESDSSFVDHGSAVTLLTPRKLRADSDGEDDARPAAGTAQYGEAVRLAAQRGLGRSIAEVLRDGSKARPGITDSTELE